MRKLTTQKCLIMAKTYGQNLFPNNCADIILHCFVLAELANKTVEELDQLIINMMALVDGKSAADDFTRPAAETLYQRIQCRVEAAAKELI